MIEDLAPIGDQRRQARLNGARRVRDRQQHRPRARILELADRRRIGRQLLTEAPTCPLSEIVIELMFGSSS